jgi:hypothetical protein
VSTALMLLGWAAAAPVHAPEPPALRSAAATHALTSAPEQASVLAASRRPTPTATPTPEPVDIPPTGTGHFTIAGGHGSVVGAGDLVRYTVEVEGGLPYDPQQVAGIVDVILADPRSWIASGEHAFQRIEADGDVRVLLSTPSTTDVLCAPLQTRGEVSCRNGTLVVINAKRWNLGIEAYGADVEGYRQYLINHEMGHALGFSHASCPGAGQVAPIMLQQSYGLDDCTPNPWPYP